MTKFNDEIMWMLDEAGFVIEDGKIDWSCNYDKELELFIQDLVTACAELAYDSMDSPELSGLGHATNAYNHIRDLLYVSED